MLIVQAAGAQHVDGVRGGGIEKASMGKLRTIGRAMQPAMPGLLVLLAACDTARAPPWSTRASPDPATLASSLRPSETTGDATASSVPVATPDPDDARGSCFAFYYGMGVSRDLPRARACFIRHVEAEGACGGSSRELVERTRADADDPGLLSRAQAVRNLIALMVLEKAGRGDSQELLELLCGPPIT